MKIKKKKLKKLLEKAFNEGALSYSNRDGQPDTCWSNVNDDMKEFSSSIMDKLNSK